jgi:hypothetical protein
MPECGCDLIEALSWNFHRGSAEVHTESTVRLAVLRNEIGRRYLPSRKQGLSAQSAKNDCM